MPHEFMLDFLAYQYHMLRTTYCMVSLLINTVIQEKAIEDAARIEAGILEDHGNDFADSESDSASTASTDSSSSGSQGSHQHQQHQQQHRQQNTHSRTSTRRTATSNASRPSSIVRPPPLGTSSGNGTIEAKILARVPNPDMHCFSLPSAVPRAFDQKQLGWSRVQKNELVRVYALERIPGQLLERACIQLVLAVLTQLRTPFLAKEAQSGKDSDKPGGVKLKKQKSSGLKKMKRKTSARSHDEEAIKKDENDETKEESAPVAASTTEKKTELGRVRSSSRSRSHELQHAIEREDSSSSSPIKKRSKHSKHAPVDPLALSEVGGSSPSGLADSPFAAAAASDHSPSNSPGASPRSARRKGSSPAIGLSRESRDSKELSRDSKEFSRHSKDGRDKDTLRDSHKSSKDSKDSHKESKDSHKDALRDSHKESKDSHKEGRKDLKDSKKNGKSKKSQKSEKSSGREVLQALQDIACEHIEWTKQGIAFTVSGDMGFSARLYSIEGPQHETALIIRVTSETFAGSSRGLRLILDNINAFVLWEYKTSVSDVFIPCSCSDCLKARSSPKYVPLPVFKNAATFTFDECERAIGAGYATLPCSVYGNEVPLDRLVPDLVMSDLEMFHADYSDIIKEVELARSSNGIVYKGTFLGETVAIKELSVRLSGDGLVDAVASEYFADFRHEVWVSSLLKHENIVGLKAFAIQTVLVNENGEEIPLDMVNDSDSSSSSSSSSSRISLSSREGSSIGNGDSKSKSSGKKGMDAIHSHKSESDFSKVHAQFGGHHDLAASNYESSSNVSTKDSISSSGYSLHSQSTPKLSSQSSSGSGYFSNMSTSSSNSAAHHSQNNLNCERIAKLAIVMEYIPNGDLYRWLNNKEAAIDWDMRLRIAEEIAQGMFFLHTLNPPILHHDLKSANIFIVDKDKDAPIVCRVGDFGEARTNFSYSSRERVDNPIWLAPEVMQKQRYESHADVYAFGIILWELFARDHPFDEYPEAKSDFLSVLEDSIIAGLRPSIHEKKVEAELPISATSNLCVPLYAYLMRECWQVDRYRRPTFARIISTLQDIRAVMTMNEKRILISEKPSASRAHHRDLTATEQEWVSIVETAERANADGASIQTIQSQNAEAKQKSDSLRTSVSIQPVAPETQSETSSTKDIPEVKTESPKKEEKPEQKVEKAPKELSIPEPVLTKSLSEILAETPAPAAESTEGDGLRKTQSIVAPTPQPAIVSPIPVIQILDPKPVIVLEEPKKEQKEVKFGGSMESPHRSDMESQKARVFSTMQSIVALNRRDSDTPPFMARRGSISGSPGPSSEALLLQYSNPSLSKSTVIGIGGLSASPMGMGGLSLRKKLATSTMIPLNFLPTTHLDDADLSGDDDE